MDQYTNLVRILRKRPNAAAEWIDLPTIARKFSRYDTTNIRLFYYYIACNYSKLLPEPTKRWNPVKVSAIFHKYP